MDGMANEVWKYGRGRVKEWIWKFCNRVWKGEGRPEIWKEGMTVPIFKKGEEDVVGDYKGVTLMSTAYKIYAAGFGREVEERNGKKRVNPT